jgi:hypothetical protein
MTIYFKKTTLDIDHSKICLDKGKKLYHYSDIYYYDIKDKSYLNSLFLVPPTKMFIVLATSQLPPHIDAGPARGCLNYYIQPQLFKTIFWKPNENAKKIYHRRYCEEINDYKEIEIGYDPLGLTMVDSFVAETNDAYFLNIGQIHSVEFINKDDKPIPRIILQFQWDATLEEILEQEK